VTPSLIREKYMLFRNCLAVMVLTALLGGCNRMSPSSPTKTLEQPETRRPSKIDVKVAGLLENYQQLPDDTKHTLTGDKLIVQIEASLPRLTPDYRRKVAVVVNSHNARLLQRALNDPDLDSPANRFEQPETAPIPRER
jgi:hypothetical protein